MAELQKEFMKFHEKIKLKRFSENQILREKRDIVLDKLRSRLNTIFKEKGIKVPTFDFFNQGGYEMGTGIQPIKGDYDIDVGIIFNLSPNNYSSFELKNIVYDALKFHTQKVLIKNPCVTLHYRKDYEEIYHVDLAIYVKHNNNLYLARGKSKKTENWELADPKGLLFEIENRFNDSDDKAQFKRIIKYLKRWKDLKFKDSGNSAPLGIGITMAVYKFFTPEKDIFTSEYNDLNALYNFIIILINKFSLVYDSETYNYKNRLIVQSPVVPRKDFFEKMTFNQMESLKSKLEILKDNLKLAIDKVDPAEATEILSKRVFGEDFPILDKKDTRKKINNSFVSNSESA